MSLTRLREVRLYRRLTLFDYQRHQIVNSTISTTIEPNLLIINK